MVYLCIKKGWGWLIKDYGLQSIVPKDVDANNVTKLDGNDLRNKKYAMVHNKWRKLINGNQSDWNWWLWRERFYGSLVLS